MCIPVIFSIALSSILSTDPGFPLSYSLKVGSVFNLLQGTQFTLEHTKNHTKLHIPASGRLEYLDNTIRIEEPAIGKFISSVLVRYGKYTCTTPEISVHNLNNIFVNLKKGHILYEQGKRIKLKRDTFVVVKNDKDETGTKIVNRHGKFIGKGIVIYKVETVHKNVGIVDGNNNSIDFTTCDTKFLTDINSTISEYLLWECREISSQGIKLIENDVKYRIETKESTIIKRDSMKRLEPWPSTSSCTNRKSLIIKTRKADRNSFNRSKKENPQVTKNFWVERVTTV